MQGGLGREGELALGACRPCTHHASPPLQAQRAWTSGLTWPSLATAGGTPRLAPPP